MRSAVLAVLLGGCLIVHTNEDVGPACPETRPELLTAAVGPMVIAGDQLYFMRSYSVFARIAATGGPVSDLARVPAPARFLAVDATSAYWAANGKISKAPLAGGAAVPVVETTTDIGGLVVDDVGIVYGAAGVRRLRHDTGETELLAETGSVTSLVGFGGQYFYSDLGKRLVRRTPPVVDLASSYWPGWIAVDADGVFYYEISQEDGGSLHVVPPGGGTPVTLIEKLHSLVIALIVDESNLYFAAEYGHDYRMWRIARTGGEPTLLACGVFDIEPMSLAQDATHIYWTDAAKLYRLAK